MNDFNRFGRVYKVYVQAEPEFRRDPKQLGLFFVRSAKGEHGPARHADLHPPHVRPGVHEPLQPVPLRRARRRARAPATPRRRRSTPSRRRRRRSCRRRWATSGRTCRTRRRGPPAWPRCSRIAILLVFLILAAQYESWGLPFSVLLGTPFAVFGAYFGLWARPPVLGELREQRVRADRRSSC